MVPQEVAVSRGVHWGERLVARRAARLLDYTTMGKWLAVPKEEEGGAGAGEAARGGGAVWVRTPTAPWRWEEGSRPRGPTTSGHTRKGSRRHRR